jgi:hypothetical protein
VRSAAAAQLLTAGDLHCEAQPACQPRLTVCRAAMQRSRGRCAELAAAASTTAALLLLLCRALRSVGRPHWCSARAARRWARCSTTAPPWPSQPCTAVVDVLNTVRLCCCLHCLMRRPTSSLERHWLLSHVADGCDRQQRSLEAFALFRLRMF